MFTKVKDGAFTAGDVTPLTFSEDARYVDEYRRYRRGPKFVDKESGSRLLLSRVNRRRRQGGERSSWVDAQSQTR